MRLLIALLWLLHWLPLPILGRIGNAAGLLVYVLMPARRRVTLINLRLCMPEMSETERRRIARQHFMGYARSLLERGILWYASAERIQRLMVIEPEVPMEEFRNHPVILLCPHFVCMELPGIATIFRTPASCMYSKQSNAVFDEALRKGRGRFGAFNAVTLVSRDQGIKPILRALRQHHPYIMLPDMDFGPRESVFVPFFGVPAATLVAPARLAAVAGARVIPTVATYLPNYRGWRIRFYPAWENFPGDDIVAATRRMNAFIEERVREAPAEYLWTHKRFKTRPPGEPGVY